jgi:hypothetical protein
MTLIETLDYFIEDVEGILQCLEWDIREETNYETNNLDWYFERQSLYKQRLANLKQIRTMIENQ